MHAKVSPPLSLNATNCKHAREYVKELNATREKEILKCKALDKVKTKEPRNKGKIISLHNAINLKAKKLMLPNLMFFFLLFFFSYRTSRINLKFNF